MKSKPYTATIEVFCVDTNVFLRYEEPLVSSWQEAAGIAHDGVWNGNEFHSVAGLMCNKTQQYFDTEKEWKIYDGGN